MLVLFPLIFLQGTIEITGLDLDLAIQGEALPNGGGFFEVADPVTGELFYTRAGSFESTVDGFVVTRDQFKYQLQGLDGPLVVAPQQGESLLARRVEQDGKINLVVNKDGADQVPGSGQIKITNFLSPQYLRRTGNGFYSNGQAGRILLELMTTQSLLLVLMGSLSNTP